MENPMDGYSGKTDKHREEELPSSSCFSLEKKTLAFYNRKS